MEHEPARTEKLINVPARGDGGTVPAPAFQMPPVVPVPVRRTGLVPEANLWNIGDRVREWTRTALTRTAAGERYGWDVSLVLAPANGAMVTTYAIVIYMPSPILGGSEVGVVRMTGDNPDEDLITNAVRSAVEELRGARSKMLKPHA